MMYEEKRNTLIKAINHGLWIRELAFDCMIEFLSNKKRNPDKVTMSLSKESGKPIDPALIEEICAYYGIEVVIDYRTSTVPKRFAKFEIKFLQ